MHTLRWLLLASWAFTCACADTADPNPDAGVQSCAAPTRGPTMHGGYLAEDETWTADGSPHLTTGDLFVEADVTLTIEPCAEVRLRTGNFLTIHGHLEARGVAGRRIVIKNATEGSRFASIVVNATGHADLAYVEISGGGDLPASNAGASIEVVGEAFPPTPSLFVDTVTVRDSAGLGVWMRSGSAFKPGSSGLIITGSGQRTDQPGYPLRTSNNTVNSIPPGTYTGNRSDEIQVIGEGVHYQSEIDDHYFDRGVPYYIGGDGALGRLEVVQSTLTLDPGVTMHFDGTNSNVGGLDILASGVLVAVGNAAAPIVLGPPNDQRTAGAWEGLTFRQELGVGNRIEHVRVEFAGGHGGDASFGCPPDALGSFESDGAIKLFTEPSDAFIRNTQITDSSSHGIFEAWNGNFVDLLPTNTFENVPGCNLVSPKDNVGDCPMNPPCPK